MGLESILKRKDVPEDVKDEIRENLEMYNNIEEELKLSKDRYKKVQEVGHIGSWEYDIKNNTFWGSDEGKRLYGFNLTTDIFSAEEVMKCVIEREKVDQAMINLIEKNKPYNIVFEINLVNSTEKRTINSIAELIRDERGFPVKVTGVLHDITERKQSEQEHLTNLHFFESIDKINRSIQDASDINNMLSNVLETTLSIFDCDRCWLVYPCDPNASSFRVPMEITKPEYPGAKVLNIDVPMSSGEAQNMREAMESDTPVTYTEGTDRPISTAEQFGVRSQMFFPLVPKMGKPWIFGMHQCSYARVWNQNEKRIFQEIARRLSDALTSLLVHQNLQESEIRLKRIIEGLTDYQYSVRIENGYAVETTQGTACEIVTGYTSEEFYADPYLWIRMVDPMDRELVRERVQQILDGTDIPPIEHRIIRKDGEVRWVCDTTILVKDTSGKLQSYHGVIKDITERKHYEQRLRESQHFIESIIESTPNLIYIYDVIEHRNIYSNMEVTTFLGYTPEQIKSMGSELFKTILHPDDEQLVAQHHACYTSAKENEVYIVEYRMKHSSGEWHWLRSRDVLFARNEKGEAQQILGSAEDITEHKKAEDALRKSEEKFLKAFQSSPISLTLAGVKDGILLEANDAFERITGYSLQESIGKTARELNLYPDPHERELFVEKLRNYKKLRNFEMHLRHKSGELRIVQCSSESIFFGKSEYILSTTQDITEQKRIEDALRKSEEKFRNLFNNSEVGMFRTKLDGSEILEFNEKYLKILGLTNEEVLGKPSKLLWVIPEERLRMVKILEAEGYVSDFECSLYNKNGEVLRCITSLRLYREHGILEGSIQDITERKRSEEALKNSEEKYRTLFEQTADGILIIDSEGNYVDANSGICKMLNYSKSEILSMNMRKIIHEEDLPKQSDTIERMLKGENVLSERRLRCKNGTFLNTELNAQMLPDGRFCAFVRNITERKKSEEEHLRLQNLESLGVLAGGIAHDFNNILTSIMGRVSMAIDDAKEKGEIENLLAIEKASKRAVGLTHQLLTFARGGSPQKCAIDISKIIKDTTSFSLSGSNVISEYNFNSSFYLEADSGQVAQVIQNLVINAKQAMPSGGKIKISTENYNDLNGSKFVKIIIEDHGIGISKEYLTKVFDPYFSTKQTGSGLGLSVCYSIIKRHEGRIFAYSEIGKGSTFTILLPATEKGNFAETKDKKITTQKYKILIMDDEEDIREMLSNLLLKLGHTFSTTSTGEEAIQIYKDEMEKGNIFDLVFMDLTIKGGMGGKEAVKKLREIDPKAKVIVSSGYSDSLISSYEESGFDGALNKPYSRDQLNEIIFEVMNK